MDLNIKAHIKIIGMLFVVLGISLVAPAIVAIIYKESPSFFSFIITLVPSIIIGAFLIRITGPIKGHFRVRDGFIIVSEAWLIISILGAFPFVISGFIPSYVDAFFETASGFSTTGSSILTDVESLSYSMLFWRSFTHWIGGMGIIVLAVAILPALGIGGQVIVSAETTGPSLSKILPKIKDTAKLLYILYFSFTVLETLLLWAGGLSIFDALTHSFATVGTGGFSTYNAGISHFDSTYVEMVITFFMFICGASFSLHFLALNQGPLVYLKDSEFKGYFIIVASVTLALTLYLFFFGTYSDLGTSFRYSIFQVVSIVTTTGFASADYIYWPLFGQILLLILFFIGGSSSSTAGGVKVVRVLTILQFVRRTIVLKLHPHHVSSVKLGKKSLSSDIVSNISSFILLYMATIFIGTILLSFDGFDLSTTFTAVISAVGNVGPGFEQVGPMLNYSQFSDFSKIVLSLLMIAGRLEVYTFFMIFSRKFWNPYR